MQDKMLVMFIVITVLRCAGALSEEDNNKEGKKSKNVKEEDARELKGTKEIPNFEFDFLYSGHKQTGKFNENGKYALRGEYYFVENGKLYKTSYVADENGYRANNTVMPTKFSPPVYKGIPETGEYLHIYNEKLYTIKYVINENGFHPTSAEITQEDLSNVVIPDTMLEDKIPHDPLIVAALLGAG